MYKHYIILIIIILTIGSFAGITNFLNHYFKGSIKNKNEAIKYIIGGIGASILVPLLLNMLSSDLIKNSDQFDILNYFVFAGFCFVAGYFSDRFIDSIGEKILKELNNKVDQVRNSTKANEEKIDFIISSDTEVDEIEEQSQIDLIDSKMLKTFEDDDIKTQEEKIIKSFKGKFKFRTAKGISKELNYSETVTQNIIDGLQEQGVVKKLTNSEGKVLCALTGLGSIISNKDK